jgi:DNA repair exonuclease SbcCD ATPase subunit
MFKINKIAKIEQYKSFRNFSWSEFCKNMDGQEVLLQKFNIIFGENGAGKSSICDIFKSLSQTQDFQTPPNLAEVVLNNQTYKFENNNWTPSTLQKNSFLFFDVDFINANIHTHGDRSNQKDKHSQNAGKIIIDLDAQANKLKESMEEKRKEYEIFEKTHTDILQQKFSEKEKELHHIHKKITDKDKEEKIISIQEELKTLETDLASLQLLNKKHSEITHLTLIHKVTSTVSLESKEKYIELFHRKIKEKAQDGADEKIKSHFEKHKTFIETAKDQISKNYSNESCPLCMQPLKNVTNVIEYYRTAFDQTYDLEKQQFLSDIQERKNEIAVLKENIELIPSKITNVFNALEKINTDFMVQDIYSLNDKIKYADKFNNISISELNTVLIALEELKNIDRNPTNIENLYDEITKEIRQIQKHTDDLNEFITQKNQSITNFKSKYSDQGKITIEIQEKTTKQSDAKELLRFLETDKINHITTKNEITTKQSTMSEELKNAQKELQTYLGKVIPESVINQMIIILNKFNLSFTIEHIKPASNTKDYSFSFRIKDKKGNEREFKDGLSEGERQLISIAFFFAINENLPNKQNTVLIFDDPITSLDSPNLKILSDLIYEKMDTFLQTIVLTHHPLFFKYLKKHGSSKQFGVLRNHEDFGGSFIYADPGFNLTDEIKKCNEEIKTNAINGAFKPEEISLKYGQLLRLAIERFIKNDLLMWNKEKPFEELTENLKQGKSKMARISDDDLEAIKNIYKYCNYSNLLHADKENPSALSELITHIDQFNHILQKAI